MIRLRENIDLKEMTTFGITAICGRLIEFSEPEIDLPELDRRGLLDKAIILGGGSNMLFTGADKNLCVIHPIANSIETTIEDNETVKVSADAGVILDNLCQLTTDNGWWGLENLSGIPGHLGGAAVQNVGAYGAEIKDVIESVVCYSTARHTFIEISVDECAYGYRDSIFKHQPDGEKLIVCKINLRLSIKPNPRLGYQGLRNALIREFNILDETNSNDTQLIQRLQTSSPTIIRETVIKLRESKLPNPDKTGSAGSFFKNPVINSCDYNRLQSLWATMTDNNSSLVPGHELPNNQIKLSAAWLIDNAGCKPLTVGGAALWQTQPLVLVNATGNATGEDVINLEHVIIKRVETIFGITLSPEVIHI